MADVTELSKEETLQKLTGKEITLIDQMAGKTTYGRLCHGQPQPQKSKLKDGWFEVWQREGGRKLLKAAFNIADFDRASLFYFDIMVYVNHYYV